MFENVYGRTHRRRIDRYTISSPYEPSAQVSLKLVHSTAYLHVSAIIPEILMLKKLIDMRFELKPQQGVADYINNLSLVTFFSS